MNFKLNLLAAAALMAASVPAFAAMQGATSGNGELLLNVRYYNGAQNSGGDDMSALFDLGVTMNDFLASKDTAGFSMNWNLNAANYGTAFADILAFAGANAANIEFNIIALDSTDTGAVVGGARYLTTAAVNTFPALSNSGLNGWSSMDPYVTANNVRGTHATEANGASTAVQADGSAINPVYFGVINGPIGDTWAGKTTADTTAKLGVAQNFYFLTASSLSNTAASSKTLFGFDLDGNGALSATGTKGNEFGKWNVSAAGVVSFANPVPVPEASTYGMMLAGLGLVGFMARRRMNRAA
jgi:hypothetical protein